MVSVFESCQQRAPKRPKSYPKSNTKSEPPQVKIMHSVWEVCTFLVRQFDGLGVGPPTSNSVANWTIIFAPLWCNGASSARRFHHLTFSNDYNRLNRTESCKNAGPNIVKMRPGRYEVAKAKCEFSCSFYTVLGAEGPLNWPLLQFVGTMKSQKSISMPHV